MRFFAGLEKYYYYHRDAHEQAQILKGSRGGDQIHYGANDKESLDVFQKSVVDLDVPCYILLGNTEVSSVARVSKLGQKYKQKLLDLCSDMFTWENITTLGELELVYDPATTVMCALVYEDHWKADLAGVMRA